MLELNPLICINWVVDTLYRRLIAHSESPRRTVTVSGPEPETAPDVAGAELATRVAGVPERGMMRR